MSPDASPSRGVPDRPGAVASAANDGPSRGGDLVAERERALAGHHDRVLVLVRIGLIEPRHHEGDLHHRHTAPRVVILGRALDVPYGRPHTARLAENHRPGIVPRVFCAFAERPITPSWMGRRIALCHRSSHKRLWLEPSREAFLAKTIWLRTSVNLWTSSSHSCSREDQCGR